MFHHYFLYFPENDYQAVLYLLIFPRMILLYNENPWDMIKVNPMVHFYRHLITTHQVGISDPEFQRVFCLVALA